MTNPGDSDEWWKQYGGEGVSSESGATASAPPPSSTPSYPAYPSNPSNPQYPAQPMTPQVQPYPSYPQSTPPPQPYAQPTGYGPAPAYQPYGYPQARSTNGLAIGAFITSLCGLLTCGVTSLVGIILGIIAVNQIKQRDQNGRGLALAAIWIGVGLIVLWIVYFVVIIVVAMHSSSTS